MTSTRFTRINLGVRLLLRSGSEPGILPLLDPAGYLIPHEIVLVVKVSHRNNGVPSGRDHYVVPPCGIPLFPVNAGFLTFNGA
jgi:hypothetical protein